jgi:hypothetical protein
MDYLMSREQVNLAVIHANTEAYILYLKLTSFPDQEHKFTGSGEAAFVALAMPYNKKHPSGGKAL